MKQNPFTEQNQPQIIIKALIRVAPPDHSTVLLTADYKKHKQGDQSVLHNFSERGNTPNVSRSIQEKEQIMNLLWITKVGSRFRGISENGFKHKAGKALCFVEFSNPEER